jgi:hypothetical protein
VRDCPICHRSSGEAIAGKLLVVIAVVEYARGLVGPVPVLAPNLPAAAASWIVDT